MADNNILISNKYQEQSSNVNFQLINADTRNSFHF